MPTDTVSIEDFITANGITLKAVRTDTNPHMHEAANMDHWKVTLRRSSHKDSRDQARMTLTFSMGFAHKGAEPKAAEVLNCLASDSSSIDQADDFEQWCSELGYDSDSRKAEKIYKACFHEAVRLKKFLGEELYDQLLYHTEKL